MEKNDLIQQSVDLLNLYNRRRSVRQFSTEGIAKEVIKNCIAIAGTAPSGANMQPWTFVLIEDPNIKNKIYQKSNEIEAKFYKDKITSEHNTKLDELNLNKTQKDFLIEAPYLIAVFKQKYGLDKDGKKIKHYYVNESVNIAIGFLLASLHTLEISSLTYTPAPMSFLNEILERPENESAVMIIPVGMQSEDYSPPDIKRKNIDSIIVEC